ncbi:MAG: antibiotic biosynthesis monooxygenase [Salinibacterium sp.]|nr:antibiotic biosynthesis monooxygenase [Salinibacterium sp.]
MNATLIARYHVKPGRAGIVEDGLRKMAARVKADEPACLIYNANVSPDDENLYCLYEVYENEDALVAHRDTPHFAEIIEGIIVPELESREREVYRRVIG